MGQYIDYRPALSRNGLSQEPGFAIFRFDGANTGTLRHIFSPLRLLDGKRNPYSPATRKSEVYMGYKREELVLKTAKEIVVKFIEVGNISPASFHDHFKNIYQTVENAVKEAEEAASRRERPGRKEGGA